MKMPFQMLRIRWVHKDFICPACQAGKGRDKPGSCQPVMVVVLVAKDRANAAADFTTPTAALAEAAMQNWGAWQTCDMKSILQTRITAP